MRADGSWRRDSLAVIHERDHGEHGCVRRGWLAPRIVNKDLYRDAADVAVFADEFVHKVADIKRLGRDDLAADIYLKLVKTGSLSTFAHLAETARHPDVRTTARSAFGTSLKIAAELNLAATIPNISSACELGPRSSRKIRRPIRPTSGRP